MVCNHARNFWGLVWGWGVENSGFGGGGTRILGWVGRGRGEMNEGLGCSGAFPRAMAEVPTTHHHWTLSIYPPYAGHRAPAFRTPGYRRGGAGQHGSTINCSVYTARIALALLEIVVRKTLQLPSWIPLALVETIASKKVNTGRKKTK